MGILTAAVCLLPLVYSLPASSSAAPFTQSYSSLNSSAWYPFTFGSYVGSDGNVTSIPRGFRLSSVFSLTAPPDGPTPGDLDHVKWLQWTTANSSAGFPGWDTDVGVINECSAKVGGSVTGLEHSPFPVDCNSPNLGNFGVTAGDFETNMIFDFVITNDRLYALYERLPFARTSTNHYASFTYLIPVGRRKRHDTHELKVAYDRSAHTVGWYVNGKKVYQVSRIGRYVGSSQAPAVDRGGVEEDVKPLRQFACGVGVFDILDGYEKNLQRSLVRLNPAEGYYQNPKNRKKELKWVDAESKQESRIWGQGVDAYITDFEASRRRK